MRYMVMLSMRSDVGPPTPELMEAMDVSMGESFASGLLIDAGGLMGDHATTFTLRTVLWTGSTGRSRRRRRSWAGTPCSTSARTRRPSRTRDG